MRDIDIGKREAERMALEPFGDAFPLLTGRSLEVLSQGESPDFEALVEGAPMGMELSEIRRMANGFDYMDEVTRLVARKGESYTRRGCFIPRPIMLVCYSKSPGHTKRA